MATRHLYDPKYRRLAEDEYRFITDRQIHTIPIHDDNYPRFLWHCPDAPLLLFCRGNINLGATKLISVVGTRNMTRHGADFCQQFLEDLAPWNPVIISGFAYGVDICAQKAAISLGLQTIGCLAHGLNQIYPRSHEQYRAPVEANGGFVTEFWSTSKPERINFLKRNRVIAGMSEATVVIESAEKGGSLVTAALATDYNREVFAVPGRPGDPFSEGTNSLIKTQRAHLLSSAADLIYHLNWDTDLPPSPGVQKRLFVEMDETEQRIHDFLEEKGKQFLDDLALTTGLPVGRAASALLSMEMKGVVRPLPGKYFELA
jgi:DNA processing protein